MGDAVLNWLWQGSVVALGTAIALRMIEPSRPQARYCAVWAGLLSVLALPLVTLIWTASSASPAAAPSSIDGASPVSLMVAIPTGWWVSSALAIWLWTLWVVVHVARVARALIALRRARRDAVALPPSRAAQLTHWNDVRSRGRRARLVVSDSVRSAAVIGCGSPLIAVAPPLLDHLEDDELDRVVVHEWAHVQRRDDLANAVQLGIQALTGWHPAVWWLDRRLQHEREAACDQMVVAIAGGAKGYAACLAKLADLPSVPLPSLPVVAAVGASGLRRRVVRVLSLRPSASSRWRPAAVAASTCLCALALGAGAFRVVHVVSPQIGDAPQSVSVASVAHPTPRPIAQSLPLAEEQVRPRESRRIHARQAERPTAPVQRAEVVTAAPTPESDATGGESPAEQVASGSTDNASVVATVSPDQIPSTPSINNDQMVSPWRAAADRGVAVGRSSQKAAVATAGLFTRFGKKIAGSF